MQLGQAVSVHASGELPFSACEGLISPLDELEGGGVTGGDLLPEHSGGNARGTLNIARVRTELPEQCREQA